jgi:hypothetical protein
VVGVLVFIDQYVPEAAPVFLRHRRHRLEQVHRGHDEVVEVQRLGLGQPPLVERVGLGQVPFRRPGSLAGKGLRVHQLVLQVGYLGCHRPGRVAFRIEVELTGDHLHQPPRVVGVVDREGGLEPGVLVLGAQDPYTGGVERGHPHQPGSIADQVGDPLLHLAGGLVGERDRDDLTRVYVPRGQQVGDPVGEHPGLTRAGTGHDQQRRPGMGHRRSLGLVEPLQQLVHPTLLVVNLGWVSGRRIRNFREGMHRTSESMPPLRQDPATPR